VQVEFVDLMGRLSNPPDTLESLTDQEFHEPPSSGQKASKAAKRSSTSPGAGDPNNRGQLSNPTKPTHHGDNEGVDSPATGRSRRRLGPPDLRRLTRSEIEEVVSGYRSGRSLADLAREFGIHHRTVADHLEWLGIARRVNLPKMSPADVYRAAARYRAGGSLATVGEALNVDASTVQRALRRAGVTIRPRPGW
jgi:DNA-binding CsgD family transcriptional regulator